MARKSLTERIADLETKRDYLMASIEKTHTLKAMEAQGNSGARTEFTDISKLEASLESVENKLSALYNVSR